MEQQEAIAKEGLSHANAFLSSELQITGELWNFLAQHTHRYTMGDSTSVQVEAARELLHSILFTLSQVQKRYQIEPEIGVEALFKEGQQEIQRQLKTGKSLLYLAQRSALSLGSISYQTTLESIPAFFARYDPLFFAHDIPCDIDYQLCIPVPESLLGIFYINRYLEQLIIENRFLQHFDRPRMQRLLLACSPLYRELLINLFEPVFINAVALELLGKDSLTLDISTSDRTQLKGYAGLEKTHLRQKLHRAIEDLCSRLNMGEPSTKSYLKQSSDALCIRLAACGDDRALNGLFPSLAEESSPVASHLYTDGTPMPDEQLRTLIDEVRQFRFLQDKLAVVMREIHSMSDLIELLETCFDDEEFPHVFPLLRDGELAYLLFLSHDLEDGASMWYTHLHTYYGGLPKERRQAIARYLSFME